MKGLPKNPQQMVVAQQEVRVAGEAWKLKRAYIIQQRMTIIASAAEEERKPQHVCIYINKIKVCMQHFTAAAGSLTPTI